MKTNILSVLQNNLILKIRRPISGTIRQIWFLIHGWTGDENSMDPFWRYIPDSDMIIAPRAPFSATPTGYGWADISTGVYPKYNEFLPAVTSLYKVITNYLKENRLNDISINLFGFSQGAAVSYMLAEMIQDKIDKIIPTAGFMPEDTLPHLEKINNKNIKFVVYHGAKDHLVPLSMADQCVSDLNKIGFSTIYCVDENAGHKLGASCIEHLKTIV
jgi:phospholipase/carboxylesterase